MDLPLSQGHPLIAWVVKFSIPTFRSGLEMTNQTYEKP